VKLNTLNISNFRQYKRKSFAFKSTQTVIHGDNTSGKSTLLEAIMMLINGASIWTNSTDELMSMDSEKYFRLEGELEFDGSIQNRVVKYDKGKLRFMINDKVVSRKKFVKNKQAFIFSPELIELIMVSSAFRRKYLNDFISKLYPEYGVELKRLNGALRQRNAVLKKLARTLYETGSIPDKPMQLDIWSEKFIDASTKAFEIKQKVIRELNAQNEKFFLQWRIGDIDLLTPDSTTFMNTLGERLEEQYRKDVARGHTGTGMHRDDWLLHMDLDIKKFGSRGEKRVAIVSLLSYLHKMFQKANFETMILIDDLPSELGEKFLSDALNQFKANGIQRIITTLRPTDTKLLTQKCDIIDLSQ